MIPLLFTDPLGDDYGLAYAYPRNALYAEAGFADLIGFEALEQADRLVLRVRLARYPNPQNAPLGFSLAVVGVYIDSRDGGPEELPGAGFRTPVGAGWDSAYVISGWGGEARTPQGESRTLEVRRNGDWIEFSPNIPPGDYGYYVTAGLYDPFTPWGFRPLRPGGGDWVLDGPVGAPPAVDVLSDQQSQNYTSGELSPVRAQRLVVPWLAWVAAGVGLASLVLGWLIPSRPRKPKGPRFKGNSKT